MPYHQRSSKNNDDPFGDPKTGRFAKSSTKTATPGANVVTDTSFEDKAAKKKRLDTAEIGRIKGLLLDNPNADLGTMNPEVASAIRGWRETNPELSLIHISEPTRQAESRMPSSA